MNHPFLLHIEQALENPGRREEIDIDFNMFLACLRDIYVRIHALESPSEGGRSLAMIEHDRGEKIMWGIAQGRILYPGLSNTAEEAMDKHAAGSSRSWHAWWKDGASVVKVTLTWSPPKEYRPSRSAATALLKEIEP